jgi:hypothetical protein
MRRDPAALSALLGQNAQGDLGPYTIYQTRKGRRVIYLRAPPKTPPSDHQRQMRLRWTVVATAWRALPPAVRSAWLTTAKRSGIRIGGYNLWLWYTLKPDPAALATICRLAGTNLEDLA